MDLWKFFIVLKFISIIRAVYSTKVNITEHVKIIMDFCHFYHSTSLTIIHFANPNHAFQKNIIFNIARMLLKEKMTTSIISFEEPTSINYSKKIRVLKKSQQYLNVIFITSINSALKMKNAAENIPLHKSINLLFFIEIDEDPLTDFCTSPVGNPFGLSFDTSFFVKCYDDNHIREWRMQYCNKTIFHDWAIWDPKLGLIVKTKESFHMNKGVNGRVLRIATVKDSYFAQWRNGSLTGFFGDLLLELQKAMNVTVKHVEDTETYGGWNETSQTWTGALGLAVNGKVDLVVSDFSYLPQRMCCLEFTVPLITVQNSLFIKQSFNKPEVSWYGHFRPFSYTIWGAIMLLLLFTPMLLTFMKKHVPEWLEKSKCISDNFLDIWAIFCQQGISDIPSASSMRLAYFAISATAFIILSFYSAFLISSLASQSINLPFETIEDLVRDGTYKVAVIRNSPKYHFLRSSNDSTLIGLTKLLLTENILPLSFQDALNMACQHERLALYDRETIVRANTVKINCQLGQITTGQYDTIAMVMSKNGSFNFLINYHLGKIDSNGVLGRNRSKYFGKNVFWTKPTYYKTVEFREIVLLLVIVGGGIILGTIILLMEKLCFIYTNAMKNKRNKISVNKIIPNVNLKMKVTKSLQYNVKREIISNLLKINYSHRVVRTPILKLLKSDK